jgi:hypothetical protein
VTEYLIVIKGDTNDADYISETNTIDSEYLEDIKPVIAAIKAHKGQHNWPTHDYVNESPQDLYPQLTEQQISYFRDLAPRGENGIHSIESVHVYELAGKVQKLL